MFQDVTIKWDDKDVTIPASQVMRAIAVVEDVVTFDELVTMYHTKQFKRAKLADAFAALLRFLGHRAEAEQLWKAMHVREGVLLNLVGVLQTLMVLLMPPPEMQTAKSSGEPEKKSES